MENKPSELNKLRTEKEIFKKEFNSAREERNKCNSEIKKFTSEISSITEKSGELRKKRDSLNSQVRQLKDKKNKINETIRNLRESESPLKIQISSISQKHGIKKGHNLYSEIAGIESHIETEVISFEKEKSLMRTLNKLKEEKKKLKILEPLHNKAREIRSEINALKRECDNIHSQIQILAEQSQSIHMELFSISKNLNKFYRDRRTQFKKSKGLNDALDELSAKIDEKFSQISSLKNDADRYDKEQKERRRKKQETIMEHSEEALRKKIMKGGKITNSDLLVFQQGDD